MKNPYGVFLTIEIARILGIIPKDLEYDLTWDKGTDLYNEFHISKYNDTTRSEYGCIEEFLKDYRRKHASEIIPFVESPIKITIYSVEKHWPIVVPIKVYNELIKDDYIHFNGRDWVYFDSDMNYITEIAIKQK
jgi:hypothetical protein